MKLRKFQISDPLWWGFNKYIDVEKYNNINDIVKYFINECGLFLESNNLLEQYDYFKSVKNKFHIHDNHENEIGTLEKILSSGEDTIIYVCRHNHDLTGLDRIVNQR